MPNTQANCPNCKKVVTLADSAFGVPAGKVAYIVCPSCKCRGTVSDFTRQAEYLQRDAAHREAKRRKALAVIERDQTKARKRLAKKKQNEDAEQIREDFVIQQEDEHQQREQEAQKQREDAERHEAELMANRTLNEKDIEAITEAVAKGIAEYRGARAVTGGWDAFFRVASFLLFLGFALGAADSSNGPAGICAAIFAAIFFWFTFRFRL